VEKAKISAYQLFVLMVLFEVGSAVLIPLAIGAKQGAWLAILIGMIGGFFLLFVYYGLYQYYPDQPPTEYVRDIIGNFFGRILAFLYVLYFVYLAARVLRDFGETLLTVAYPNTPLFVANALFILVVVYTVQKGIEVLARTGELLFVLEVVLIVTFIILVIVSGLVHFSNLKPVLEAGWLEVMKTAFTETLYFPFGEIIVFLMIFPYVNQPEKVKKMGLAALGVSGLFLAFTMALTISVLGVALTARAQYPLLLMIQSIEVAGFVERLDVYFLFKMMIGMFFKIGVFTYVAVTAAASVFNIKEPSRLSYPIGFVILLISIIIASSYAEHIKEGLDVVPLYVHLPFQVIIPIFLLIIAFFKNRKKSRA
jgi:spore germination protein KB